MVKENDVWYKYPGGVLSRESLGYDRDSGLVPGKRYTTVVNKSKKKGLRDC